MNGQPPWMERGGSSPGSPTDVLSSQKQPLLPNNDEDAAGEEDGGGAFWQKSAQPDAASPATVNRHNGHAFHFANPSTDDGSGVGGEPTPPT
jgi:hypothetical protein